MESKFDRKPPQISICIYIYYVIHNLTKNYLFIYENNQPK